MSSAMTWLIRKSRIPGRKQFWLPVIPGILLLGWNIGNLLRLPLIKTMMPEIWQRYAAFWWRQFTRDVYYAAWYRRTIDIFELFQSSEVWNNSKSLIAGGFYKRYQTSPRAWTHFTQQCLEPHAHFVLQIPNDGTANHSLPFLRLESLHSIQIVPTLVSKVSITSIEWFLSDLRMGGGVGVIEWWPLKTFFLSPRWIPYSTVRCDTSTHRSGGPGWADTRPDSSRSLVSLSGYGTGIELCSRPRYPFPWRRFAFSAWEQA